MIDAVDETFVYVEPLAGEWRALQHPFLLAEQGEPEAGWVRSGPAALTRAWCIFELAKALAKGCTLHMLLSPESVRLFERKLRRDPGGFHWAGKLLDGIDVKRAQLSKVEDRRALAALSPTPP